jgi:hypothetical protein
MISAWQTLQENDFGPHMEPAAVVVEESTPHPPTPRDNKTFFAFDLFLPFLGSFLMM